MPSAIALAPSHTPRRARYLVPLGLPRRREFLAAVGAAAVVAGVLFAPLTLLLAAACHVVSKASRWRPLWLLVPAACGSVWVLAIGPLSAASALSRPAAAAARAPGSPAALAGFAGAVARGLPGQFPAALILAAGLAAVAWWVRWLHTDEWDVPATRPGLASICLRRWTTASVRAGHVLTRDGACLGVIEVTGRPAALPWRDAGGGVLVTGAARPAVLASGIQLAHAAIRRRKPLIVVDLTGNRELPAVLAAICAPAGAPLYWFGAAGGFRYEPRVDLGEEHRAALRAAPWQPRPGPGPAAGARAGVDEVVRQRAVALFALDRRGPGDAAELVAGLVAADVAALYTRLSRHKVAPDGMCWYTECDGVDPAALAGLVAAGSPAGLAPVLASTVPRTAAALAGQVSAGVIHRVADFGLAAELASMTGTTIAPLSCLPAGHGAGQDGTAAPSRTEPGPALPLGTMLVPVVTAETLCALGSDEFMLVTGLSAAEAADPPRHRAAGVRARCRAVRGRLPGRAAPLPPARGLPDLPARRWPP